MTDFETKYRDLVAGLLGILEFLDGPHPDVKYRDGKRVAAQMIRDVLTSSPAEGTGACCMAGTPLAGPGVTHEVGCTRPTPVSSGGAALCGRSVHSFTIGGSSPCGRAAGHEGSCSPGGFVVHETAPVSLGEAGNQRLACAYGGHQWVRGPASIGGGFGVYTRDCSACGAAHVISERDWMILDPAPVVTPSAEDGQP